MNIIHSTQLSLFEPTLITDFYFGTCCFCLHNSDIKRVICKFPDDKLFRTTFLCNKCIQDPHIILR